MKLGKYFTLEELTVTNTGLKNIPTADDIERLRLLVTNVLDPIREIYGKPIKVNSGYRSEAVNAKVKGSATSQHKIGEAADITCPDNKKLFQIIKQHTTFDQLINEQNLRWIHVSFTKRKPNRRQIINDIQGSVDVQSWFDMLKNERNEVVLSKKQVEEFINFINKYYKKI